MVTASKDGEEKKRIEVHVTSTSDREAKGLARASLHKKGYKTHSAIHYGYDHNFWDKKNESTDMCSVCGQTPCNCTHVNEAETFCLKCNQDPCVCGGNHIEDLNEKTLTKAELKKREEVAKALERKNPGMDMGRKMAIATAVAKRVAEQALTEAKDKEEEKLPSMETSFGSHSVEKFPAMETTFGTHQKKPAGDKMLPAMGVSFGSHSKILRTKKVMESLLEEVSKNPKKAKDQIGKDTHDLHKSDKLKQNYSLLSYTSNSSMLNNNLHKHFHGKKTQGPKNTFKQRVNEIDSALDNASLSKDTHVFTGLPQGPHELFKRHKIEKGQNLKVHLPAYTSTSTEYARAKRFASSANDRSSKFGAHVPVDHTVHEPLNELSKSELATIKSRDHKQKHILKIHLPKGTKAGSVKHFSQYGHENEILLHRGHNLEIHHRPTVEPDGTHVWHARVIGHSPAEVK